MSVVQSDFGKNVKCSICKLSEIDTLNYGEIHCNKELSVHLFCLYFLTHLLQRGQNNAGIVGFELRDIRALIKNTSEIECCYCQKKSATTHCHEPNCKRVFHQVCGFKANARFEYFDIFRSYCDLHNQISEKDDMEYPKEYFGCWICYEELGDYHPVKTIPTCCNKWLHQQCLRWYALNAGYTFTCPLCRNKNYGDFARRHGVYVPEYEALWEQTNDYTDIERFYSRCDAKICLCPQGSSFSNYKWTIKVCSHCGSYGLHTLCRPENERLNEIICDVCSNIFTSVTQRTTNHVNVPQTSPILNNHGDAPDTEMDIIDLTIDDDDNKSLKEKNIFEENVFEYNIFEENMPPENSVTETLQEKHCREKAERPLRDEMRNFRLSLLFKSLDNK